MIRIHVNPINLAEEQYFQWDGYIRNSTLSRIEKQMLGHKAINEDYKEPYRYGSAFDFYYTNRECFMDNLIVEDGMFFLKSGRETLHFSLKEFECIVANARALDEAYPDLRKGYLQHVIKSDTFQVGNYSLKAKVKCDMYFEKGQLPQMPSYNVVVDLKTTTAKTMDDFMKRFKDYQYDRAGAFYKDVAGANAYILIGVNRQSEVFHFPIIGDTLRIGREKYHRIIHYGFQNNLIQ